MRLADLDVKSWRRPASSRLSNDRKLGDLEGMHRPRAPRQLQSELDIVHASALPHVALAYDELHNVYCLYEVLPQTRHGNLARPAVRNEVAIRHY